MGAITVDTEQKQLTHKPERCIGCGLRLAKRNCAGTQQSQLIIILSGFVLLLILGLLFRSNTQKCLYFIQFLLFCRIVRIRKTIIFLSG